MLHVSKIQVRHLHFFFQMVGANVPGLAYSKRKHAVPDEPLTFPSCLCSPKSNHSPVLSSAGTTTTTGTTTALACGPSCRVAALARAMGGTSASRPQAAQGRGLITSAHRTSKAQPTPRCPTSSSSVRRVWTREDGRASEGRRRSCRKCGRKDVDQMERRRKIEMIKNNENSASTNQRGENAISVEFRDRGP